MSDYKTLLAQKAELEALIAGQEKEARVSALAEVRSNVALFKFNKKEVFGKQGTGIKLPPKYRNPETGATWTGRGKAPNWVVGDKEAYLIQA